MGDKWKDVSGGGGIVESVIDTLVGGGGEKGGIIGDTRCVKNEETGEIREVYRGWGQTTGDAIKEGQFKDKK